MISEGMIQENTRVSFYVVLAFAISTSWLARWLTRTYLVYCRRSALCKDHDCSDPRISHSPIFTWKSRNSKRKTDVVDDVIVPRFEKYGYTHIDRHFMTDVIYTVEPANICAIHSSQFENFQVGPYRSSGFWPAGHRNLFTKDGAEWKRSRLLVALCMKGPQISRIEVLEPHMRRLFRVLDNEAINGWSKDVDISEIFTHFSTDTSFELISGEDLKFSDAWIIH
jgi:hypothetical protein